MLDSLEAATPAELQLLLAGLGQFERRQLARERRYLLPGTIWGDVPAPYSAAKNWTAYGPECVGPHAGRRPLADRHSWLCGPCSDRIRRDLFTLAAAWGFLADLLQRGPGSQGERSGSSTDAAAPLDMEIAEIRRTVTAWCWSLIEHMLEDRPAMSPPADTETPALLRWAGAWHVPYIATHPESSFPQAMQAELADMVRRVRARLFPDGIRRQRLPATCDRWPADVELQAEPVKCGGQLFALIRDAADPLGSAIVCEADPTHEIPQSEWLGILKAKRKGKA
jgi:hypothetical protein